jgi:uncharacterized protein YkwD
MTRVGVVLTALVGFAAASGCKHSQPPQRSAAPAGPRAELGESTLQRQESEGDLPAPPPPSAATAPKSNTSDLELCVAEVNHYRRKLGLRALERSPELEACAAEGARVDHASGQPHGHFMSTQGCGISFAENEIPRWPLDYAGSVTNTIKKGIADMWAEGPGGGHYENMKGDYTELGCGIFVDGSAVTVVQDYK